MRTALSLALVLLVGCGSRSPGGSDGGASDGPVPPQDAVADGSAPDGAASDAPPDGPAPDGVVQHDAGHDVNRDGANLTECALAGGRCVGVFPNNCPGGEIVALSCGGGVGVACCMTGDGGTGCLPSGSCAYGPACGLTCCNAGERCDPITSTCRCGAAAGCTGGDTCVSPVMPVSGCGNMCCGVTTPCPV